MPLTEYSEEKTEKPTRRKRERAREQGMTAQSAEVNSAFVLLAALGALVLFGGSTFQVMADDMAGRLGRLYGPEITIMGAHTIMCESLRAAARAAAPIMVLTGLVGLLCSVAQTGLVFAPNRLALDFSVLHPARGLRTLFSADALVRLAVAVVKLVIIGLIVYFLVRGRLDWLFGLISKSTWGILDVSRSLCLSMVLRIVVAMMAVAVLDYAWQRWRFERQLMMSKTELREEYRRDEGDPQVRGRQEQARRALARSRMMQAVPKADVVVTNPAHIAVALRWDERQMSAPQVVAKGRDWLAERIKQVAREHGVPVLERRVLAQALYQAVEVGTEIPPKLYYAVAEVLAFVLKKRRA